MTVPTTIDAAAWLSKYLEGDDGDTDLARAMLQAFAETLMSAEASAIVAPLTTSAARSGRIPVTATGAGRGTPGPARSTWPCRSCGRGATSRTGCLTPRRRAEQALVAVIGQAYVEGVSTRRVDDLVKAMGIEGISRSEVLADGRRARRQGGGFRDRPLDCGPYRYLWIDALTQKVREGGRVVNVSAVIATAVNAEGRREIVGFDIVTAEDTGRGPSSSGAWWPAAWPALSWSSPTPTAGSKRPSPRCCPTPPGSGVGRTFMANLASRVPKRTGR